MEMTYTGGRRRAACMWSAQRHLDEHPCSLCAPLRDPSIAFLNLGVPLCVVVMFGELRLLCMAFQGFKFLSQSILRGESERQRP